MLDHRLVRLMGGGGNAGVTPVPASASGATTTYSSRLRRLRSTSSRAALALAPGGNGRRPERPHVHPGDPLGVGTSTITDDDFDGGVSAEPVGEHLRGTVVQQVNRPMCFEVDQQRAIATKASPASQRHVIDPSTRGAAVAWSSRAYRIRSNGSGLVGTPAFWARRAPPSPPACSANVFSNSVVPSVRRAYVASAPSNRSAKTLREQLGASQNHRRVWTRKRTLRPRQGRSSGRRS
jgi:hypothetical protein